MKKIFGGCLVLVALLIGVAVLALPKRYEVSRSVVMAAPSEEIHEHLYDLREWAEWSSWNDADPDMSMSYSGPETGVDSRMTWTSETQGDGSLVVTASDPRKGLWADLDLSGMPAKCAITYEPAEGGTKVTWTTAGKLEGLTMRAFGLFADGLLGASFDQNLANIQALVEDGTPDEVEEIPEEPRDG